jgi:hypothetical protein
MPSRNMFLAYFAHVVGIDRLVVTSRLDIHMPVCLSSRNDL